MRSRAKEKMRKEGREGNRDKRKEKVEKKKDRETEWGERKR